jgi:predicted amidohydrolase YtcJ
MGTLNKRASPGALFRYDREMRLIRLIGLICLAAALSFAAACTMPPTSSPPASSAANGTLFVGEVAAGPRQTPQKNWGVYVEGEHIAAVGPANELRTSHAEAQVIDVTGSTILPGLIDAHGHLYGLGLSLDTVNLVGAPAYEDVIVRVKARAARAAANEWVLGRGWDQNRWPGKQFPTAALLDAAVSDHPVWLRRIDGHAGIANSAAMRVAGVTAATPDPEGGRIVRDAAGNPTGVFIDGAQALIDSAVPRPSHELRKARLQASAQKIAENGLTEMHDAGAEAETIACVRELIDEGKFPIRVYMMLADNDGLERTWFAQKPLIGYGGRLTVRSVKLYADGALGSRGAALLEPYSDEPGNRGLHVTKVERMLEVTKKARAAGYQVNIHAIGDRGVADVIDTYEAADVQPPDRFRIEHFQVVAPNDFSRAARLGIIASMQPTHATSDMPWAADRLGPGRVKGAYAWRTVLDRGGRLALGSDFPVEDVNPFFGIYSAVTRQDQKGNPPGGWYPDQRLTLQEAIRGFTQDAAFAAFEESSRGTIEPGKLADLTIVQGDLFSTPASELFKTKVRATVVGGRIVYQP